MTQQQASNRWYAMSAMERYAIMERVPYQKSQIKRLRACISLLQKEG